MSLPDKTVIELPQSRIHDAAELLSRAFWDDPMTVFLFPDITERKDLQPQFFIPNIKHALIAGRAYTTSSFKGISVWRFFGDETKRIADGTDDPRNRLPEAVGNGPFQRLMTIIKCTYDMHKGLVKGKHWYLLFLGVEPGQQGIGIGSLLVNPVLKMADEQCLPCYLETMKQKNLAFYHKHGFQVVAERQTPDGGPYIWALLRPTAT